jgi:Tyrosine-protein kinase ephrin type A/B receptor-like
MLRALICLAVAAQAAALCPEGTFYWTAEGLEHCQQCQPGCACPGNWTACVGCAGGLFSPTAGAAACAVCPPGTTTDIVYNVVCEPQNVQTPCANEFGPLGFDRCHPVPPPAQVAFVMPSGALRMPPQYLPGGPPYIPNKVLPYFDANGQPTVQQSY